MTSPDQNTPTPPFPNGGDDDIIELTELVDEAPAEVVDYATAEVVLDFSPDSDLSALKAPAEPPEEPDAPAPAPGEESLDDFLSSLPELSPDLDLSLQTPLPPPPAALALGQELAAHLSDEELRELVRQVIQETVERLAREVFPDMAAQAIDRELARWKKRLSDPD
jgi:hypothetical protein